MFCRPVLSICACTSNVKGCTRDQRCPNSLATWQGPSAGAFPRSHQRFKVPYLQCGGRAQETDAQRRPRHGVADGLALARLVCGISPWHMHVKKRTDNKVKRADVEGLEWTGILWQWQCQGSRSCSERVGCGGKEKRGSLIVHS